MWCPSFLWPKFVIWQILGGDVSIHVMAEILPYIRSYEISMSREHEYQWKSKTVNVLVSPDVMFEYRWNHKGTFTVQYHCTITKNVSGLAVELCQIESCVTEIIARLIAFKGIGRPNANCTDSGDMLFWQLIQAILGKSSLSIDRKPQLSMLNK